jgi:hypothetical protein
VPAVLKAAVSSSDEGVKSMVEAVQNTKKDPTAAPVKPKVDENGRREMQGPGFDIASLMGGIMMPPPPPMNSTAKLTPVPESDDDSVSDIVSISGESTGGEVKDVRIKPTTKKVGSKPKKNEISI